MKALLSIALLLTLSAGIFGQKDSVIQSEQTDEKKALERLEKQVEADRREEKEEEERKAKRANRQFNSSIAVPAQIQENWQTFAPEAEEFSVEIPASLRPGAINDPAVKTTASRSYRSFINGIYYYIFSDSLKHPVQKEVVFRFAGSLADENQQNVVFKFVDNSGFHHRVATLKTRNRIYTFQTVGDAESSPQTDRFFAGIKIDSKTPELTEAAPSDNEADSSVSTNKETEKSGSGKGNSTGSGIGGGSVVSNPPDPENTPLLILTKARALYTDFARFYQITGNVRVRVTFLVNGSIGSASPVNKLPFGLTEQAVEAAKSITFKPPTRNGQPYTVTKIVEYGFVIY